MRHLPRLQTNATTHQIPFHQKTDENHVPAQRDKPPASLVMPRNLRSAGGRSSVSRMLLKGKNASSERRGAVDTLSAGYSVVGISLQ
ncbi:hypothetical protein B0H10DRAFT_2027681 [Mycena sp. CBHHK59/15]|nr:hypothetical protein B0H10DRAFT_2027681 [Mycena sp. CBHHK59/15]